MPYKFENLPLNWKDIDHDCQNIPLICPWTFISEDKNLTVVTTFLKWTFNYDFWIRVSAHLQGKPILSIQIDIIKHHPLLASLSEALSDYEDFSQAHLNSYQLHFLGQLLDFLFSSYNTQNGQYSTCLS